MIQVGQSFAGKFGFTLASFGGEHHRAHRNRQDQVLPTAAVLVAAETHGARVGLAVGEEAVVQKAGGIGIGLQNDRSTMPAVATVRSRQRLVLLTTYGGRSIPAVATLDMDGDTIHECTHSNQPLCSPTKRPPSE